jgi:hypothetical protein
VAEVVSPSRRPIDCFCNKERETQKAQLKEQNKDIHVYCRQERTQNDQQIMGPNTHTASELGLFADILLSGSAVRYTPQLLRTWGEKRSETQHAASGDERRVKFAVVAVDAELFELLFCSAELLLLFSLEAGTFSSFPLRSSVFGWDLLEESEDVSILADFATEFALFDVIVDVVEGMLVLLADWTLPSLSTALRLLKKKPKGNCA